MSGATTRSRRGVALAALLALLVSTVPAAALAEGLQAASPDATEGQDIAAEVVAGEELAVPTAEPEPVPVADDAADDETGEAEEAGQPADEPAADDAADAADGAAAEEAPEDPVLEPAAPVVPTAPSASVTVAAGTYVLQLTLADGKVVHTASSPTAGSAVQMWSYGKSNNNQKWVVERHGSTNWYVLRSAANKTLALGVAGTTSGAKLVMATPSDSDPTKTLWAFVPNGDGSYRLVSAANDTLAAAVSGSSKDDGTDLALASSKGGVRQRVLLINTVPQVAAGKKGLEGAYLLTEKASGLVADIEDGKTSNSADFALAKRTGETNQQIYLEPVDGGGYYTAWVVGTRKVLAVVGSSILSGTDVRQYSHSGSEVQKWAVVEVSGGYELVNKATGLRLTAEGTKVGSGLCGGATGSVFTLKQVALLEEGIVEVKPRSTSAVSLMVAGSSAKSGAGLVLQGDTDVLSQRFELVSAGGTDLWRVRTASSGGYLTVRDKALQQYGKGKTKASAANTWRATFRGGWYGLMLADGSNLALNLTGGKAEKGTKVGVAAANGTDAQHFTFTPARLLREGNHFFKNRGGKYLDVKGNASTSGTNVHMFKKTPSSYLGEQFTIEKTGDYVRLKNTYSGLYVTAAGRKAGANVLMRTSSGGNNQKWEPIIADGGYVSFRGVGAYSKRVLSVAKNSRRNRANVNMGTLKGTRGQLWKPIKSSYKLEGYIKTAIRKANASSSATGWFLVVDRAHTHVVILKGGNGNWKLYKSYLCSVGKPSSPTITGSYTVGSKGDSFTDNDHTCYYWTEIRGDYLFHSVLYRAGTKRILDGRLGYHISMGCVRLDINAAKLIHDMVPSGTKILIY